MPHAARPIHERLTAFKEAKGAATEETRLAGERSEAAVQAARERSSAVGGDSEPNGGQSTA